jgi:hypothetical protein
MKLTARWLRLAPPLTSASRYTLPRLPSAAECHGRDIRFR